MRDSLSNMIFELKELREGSKRVSGGRVIQAEGATHIYLIYLRDSEVASMAGAEKGSGRGVRDEF